MQREKAFQVGARVNNKLAALILLFAVALPAHAQPQSPAGQQSFDFVPPVATYHPDARYTDKALKHGRHGTVVLSVSLDATGNVTRVKETSKKLGDGLDKGVIATVRSWGFEPAQRGGQAVPCQVIVEVAFQFSGAGNQGKVVSAVAAENPSGERLPLSLLSSEPVVVESVGGEVAAPRGVYQPDPSYTPRARRKKIQGVIVLRIVVDASGRVADVKKVRGLEPSLDEKAMQTVRAWKFEPATLHGAPVAVRMVVMVRFKLF